EGGPEVLVRNTADLLYGILNNKAKTLPLARKGCGHVRAENPKAVSSVDFAMRSMDVTADLRFLNQDDVAQDNWFTREIATPLVIDGAVLLKSSDLTWHWL